MVLHEDGISRLVVVAHQLYLSISTIGIVVSCGVLVKLAMLATENHQGFCKHLGDNYAWIILQDNEMAIFAVTALVHFQKTHCDHALHRDILEL